MFPQESNHSKNIKIDKQVVIRLNDKIKDKVNLYDGYDYGYGLTENDNPFSPLFKFYRFTGISFLGRESLNDATQTRKWLLKLEISSFLLTIGLTIYWNIVLLNEAEYESMDQSTVGQIILPGILFNMELISCMSRIILNCRFEQVYQIQWCLFELIDDKKSVFRKLRKVVRNIIIISSMFLSLSFVYASANLYVTQLHNPNYSYIDLAIQFIMYLYYAFTSK